MVENFSLLIGITLIGYFYLSGSNLHRDKFVNWSNYETLFESIIWGIFHFAIAWIVLSGIKAYVGVCSWKEAVVSFQGCTLGVLYPFPYFDVLVIAFLLAFLLNRLVNLLIRRDKVVEEINRESSLINALVLDALHEKHLIQVTTIRGKVYIGWIWMGPRFTRNSELREVPIVPLMSGHRDITNQNMKIDFSYAPAIEVVSALEDLSIYIPIDEVALIRKHDFDVERSFTRLDGPDSGE